MSMFQKRHYLALAQCLHKAPVSNYSLGMICLMLENDNPNFDRDRFQYAVTTGEMIGADIKGGPAMPTYKGGNRLMKRNP